MVDHAKILRLSKGYRGAANNIFRCAIQAVHRAQTNQYKDRRNRKRSYRTLWIARINAAIQYYGLNYSRFMGYYTKTGIALNRKMLAELAVSEPISFRAIALYTLQEFKDAEAARIQPAIEREQLWVTRDNLTDEQIAMTEYVGQQLDKQKKE
mmetsp:Transcript_36866/g.63353  ORF Transcript_36866/g.63353 Transcript_36866/m.63353 type:complete len:153 (-) Transcript_36866:60-518(-)